MELAETHYRHYFQTFLLLGIMVSLLAACGSSSQIVRRQSNAATATPGATTHSRTPFDGPITYVALGASDAVGVGSDEPESQGYVPLIAARLPSGSHMLNLGISGIHLHQALTRELPLALSTSPQLITIWLVANDFKDGVNYQNYISDLKDLLSQLHSGTRARIVMANLPDLTLLPAFSSQTATQKTQTQEAIKQWNQGISQIAARYGVAIVDLFQDGSEITAHPDYISGDGFHPSAQGYVRLAQLFWQVIQGV